MKTRFLMVAALAFAAGALAVRLASARGGPDLFERYYPAGVEILHASVESGHHQLLARQKGGDVYYVISYRPADDRPTWIRRLTPKPDAEFFAAE